MTTTKEAYAAFMANELFLQKLFVHMVNNRIQEFADPLTSTLVLLATSPVQLVFCESGLILFKTNVLPVLPYSILSKEQKQVFQQWIHDTADDHESCDSSGQFTLSLPLLPKQPHVFLCKKALLSSFVFVMRHHNGTFNNPAICSTLCNIILQRFMAHVPVPSDIVSAIMSQLNTQPPPPPCLLLQAPSSLHYAPITDERSNIEAPDAANNTTSNNKRKRTKHQSAAAQPKKKKEPNP
jgi:hypothetical protein